MLFILHSYILFVFANFNYVRVADAYKFGNNKLHENNKLAALVCFQKKLRMPLI